MTRPNPPSRARRRKAAYRILVSSSPRALFTRIAISRTIARSRDRSEDVDDVAADHNPPTHDGSGKGGVGVSEMRERKMQGQGLPSKQVGDLTG